MIAQKCIDSTVLKRFQNTQRPKAAIDLHKQVKSDVGLVGFYLAERRLADSELVSKSTLRHPRLMRFSMMGIASASRRAEFCQLRDSHSFQR